MFALQLLSQQHTPIQLQLLTNFQVQFIILKYCPSVSLFIQSSSCSFIYFTGRVECPHFIYSALTSMENYPVLLT